MKKYQTEDGMILTATTAEELVSKLHAMSLAQAKNDEAWMEDVAQRTWQSTGKSLRWGYAADFIEDMLATGLLKELKS
jgi:hypothetical protein